MKKFVKLMALLMAAAMLLTGCAGNNQSGNNTATRDDLV